jgi:hypothetical protein
VCCVFSDCNVVSLCGIDNKKQHCPRPPHLASLIDHVAVCISKGALACLCSTVPLLMQTCNVANRNWRKVGRSAANKVPSCFTEARRVQQKGPVSPTQIKAYALRKEAKTNHHAAG